jgi:hypothetical protein
MVTISTGLNTDEWQQVAGALQKAAKQGKGSLPKATVTPKTNPLGHITATGISIRTHADKADRIVEQLEVLLSKWLHPKQVFKIHNPQEK